MSKVFLGGTCNNSTWRDIIIPKLKIDYFNPVVDNWNDECIAEEIKQRKECDFVLYVLTSEMKDFYSIAEVVDDSHKIPGKLIFCYLNDGFNKEQIKKLELISNMVKENGATVLYSLDQIVDYLNGFHKEIL